MTVQELCKAAPMQKISIRNSKGVYDEIDPFDAFIMSVFGDFVIEKIRASDFEELQIDLKLVPIKAQSDGGN